MHIVFNMMTYVHVFTYVKLAVIVCIYLKEIISLPGYKLTILYFS